MGLHVQVDERLLHRADRCCVLPPLLQLRVHPLAESAVAQDGRAVAELRGHTHELLGFTRDEETAHQGHAEETVQGAAARWS